MSQGYDAGVHPNAQGWKGGVGFGPGRQAAFLGRLFMASDQAQAQRGPHVWPRQSRQEFEQRLLRDFAASALHAGEARQPPARAEAQRLGLEGPVAREAPAQRQARGARAFRRRHHLSAGARHRGFRHRARRAGREKRRGELPSLLYSSDYGLTVRYYRTDSPRHDSRHRTHAAAPRAPGLPEGGAAGLLYL